jgi:hypothetical protein
MYAINESALQRKILKRKNKAIYITNISELLMILVNGGAGCFIFILNAMRESSSIALYVMAGWMFLIGTYMLFSRIKRLQTDKQYDRSILGDINYAVFIATNQVRISQLGRWNAVPISILSAVALWQNEKSIWIISLTVLFFVLVYVASGREHNFYVAQKKELETLKKNLTHQD